MDEFRNIADLSNWMNSMGVDISLWGEKNTKTLNNLWDEYINGEAFFETDPPRRQVRVVQVIIGRDKQILVEAAQEFVDGQYRRRNRPPSEKIKSGESIETAARRCLYEELGLADDQVTFDLSGGEKQEKIIDSPSYPGLLTQYTLYIVKASVDDLPKEAFWRENTAIQSGDPVRRHLWDWVDED